MRKILLAAIVALAVSTAAQAATVKFAWDANTEPNLAGYKLYCSTTNTPPFTLVSATNLTTITTTLDLTAVNNYCAVTAYNTDGLESDYSNVVTIYPLIKPSAPKNLKRN